MRKCEIPQECTLNIFCTFQLNTCTRPRGCREGTDGEFSRFHWLGVQQKGTLNSVSEVQNSTLKHIIFFFRSSEELLAKTDFKLVLLEIRSGGDLALHTALPPRQWKVCVSCFGGKWRQVLLQAPWISVSSHWQEDLGTASAWVFQAWDIDGGVLELELWPWQWPPWWRPRWPWESFCTLFISLHTRVCAVGN